MTTNALPGVPSRLTADEAAAMLQHQLKKHHVAIILLHWFNAGVWALELLTGLALITATQFRAAPDWYIALVQGIAGRPANMLHLHIVLGLLWIGVFIVYGVFGFRTYLSGEVLRKEIALDRDDVRWLVVRVLGILGRTREPLPPQGIYNAGQKLFAVMVYAFVPVIMLSGVVMAFRLFGPAAIGWAIVLHFSAVGVVVSGLLIHVYMGAVFPEEKPAFFSMLTGTVNELFAYHHHFKWWTEMKAKEEAWRRQHDEGDNHADPNSGPPAL